MKKKFSTPVGNYLSLVKFSHTIFALPFAVIGFFLGAKEINFHFKWETALLVLFCMIFARTAAMSFNRWTDRKIDSINPRTQMREIPSGKIKENQALIFTVINASLFIACTFFINKACFVLSPFALLVTLGYSYTKRFTALCHVVLGIGLSLAPIGAYLALTGYFSVTPVLISLSVLFWVSGFDIIYALQDEEFDQANDLHSIPVLVGKKRALQISRLLHVFSSGFLIYAGYTGNLHGIFYTGCILFSLLLVYQHSLVKAGDLKKVNLAFFTTNGIASVLFAIFTVADLLFYTNTL